MDDDPPVAVLPHHVPPESAAEFADAVGDRLPEGALVRAATPDRTAERLPEADAVVTYRLGAEEREAAPDLRWIQALSAGVEHYDREALDEAGVVLTNASGVHAEPIAEQVLGYLLAFRRGFPQAFRQQRRGVWERVSGGELADDAVGILGVGAIGSRVAELVDAVGCRVVGTKRDTSTVPDAVDRVFTPGDIDRMLERADHLVVACPLTDETRGLVGADELRLLDSEAVVVNVARGEVIDQEALVRSLRGHRIGGAALDVFAEEPLPPESPLWDLSNVIVTPHTAGSTPHYTRRCADLFVENYRHFRAGDLGAMTNRVV
jgi:phosphoglycerate dehydrogenase-like enzyme